MPMPLWWGHVNKRLINPRALAGGRWKALHHVGRTSGRAYVTPLDGYEIDGRYLFVLVYGSRSDWVQNIIDAGEAILEADGEELVLASPRVIGRDEAEPLLAGRAKLPPRLLKIGEYLEMDIVTRRPAGGRRRAGTDQPTMKAVTRHAYGGPEALSIEDVAEPVPGPGEVVVEVVAASLNTADLDDLQGSPWASRIGRGLIRPKSHKVGLDVSGRVVAVGEGVVAPVVGTEVWADLFSAGRGSLAERVLVPSSALHVKPPGVGFEAAATLPHSGVLALRGLGARGGVAPGQHVLVNGAGGCVGPFAIQMAKAAGAEVTAVDSRAKFDLMSQAGADHLVDYAEQNVTRNGVRYDRILDIAANRSFFAYRRSLNPGGAYVLVARTIGGFVATALAGGLMTLFGPRSFGVFGWEPNRERDLSALAAMVESGRVRPIIDRTYPLSGAIDAMHRLAAGEARGKILISG